MASRACIALALALVLGLALAVTACGRSREQAERSCDDACSAVQAKVHDLDPSDASPALDIEGDDRAIEETLKNADALCAAAQKTDRATYIRSWVERERGRDKERAAEQARVADGFLMDEWRMRERSIRAALADARRLGPKSSAWGAYVHSARAALDRFRPTRLVKTPAWIELDALATATQKELDLLPRPKARADAPPDPSPEALLERYGCRTGAMLIQINGFDPCTSSKLVLCDLGADEDKSLIELAKVGCTRNGTSKDPSLVCCPPWP